MPKFIEKTLKKIIFGVIIYTFDTYGVKILKKENKLNDENEEECVLYDRKCIGCGECELCDLDPLKICDNCGKCIDMKDVASVKIDGIEK